MLNLYEKPHYKMGPFETIKWWFRRAKYARQRARWGFSEYDVWNLNTYLAELLKDMFTFWAKHQHSHPYDITAEEWQQTLINISECFAQYNRDFPQPAYETFKEATIRKKEKGCITVEAPDELLRAGGKKNKRFMNIKCKSSKRGLIYYLNITLIFGTKEPRCQVRKFIVI